MCTGLEPMLLGGLAAGAAMSTMMAPKMPTPSVPTPEKPPQASKQPERAAMGGGATGAAGMGAGPGAAGNAGTFLTGPSGIAASSLDLGKNTLLGQ